MKHLLITAITVSTLSSAAFAGSTTHMTSTPPSAPTHLFAANEVQYDLFGAYMVGKGPVHAGPLKDHGWGGGLGINYFFTEMLGVGADVTELHGVQNRSIGISHKTLTQGTGSVILRLPMEEYNIAPYGYVGGGITGRFGDGNLASVHAGLGVEYRLVPNSIGLFTDARWTYYGDAHGNGDMNNFQARAGIRFVF